MASLLQLSMHKMKIFHHEMGDHLLGKHLEISHARHINYFDILILYKESRMLMEISKSYKSHTRSFTPLRIS